MVAVDSNKADVKIENAPDDPYQAAVKPGNVAGNPPFDSLSILPKDMVIPNESSLTQYYNTYTRKETRKTVKTIGESVYLTWPTRSCL